jgi:LacI family transcriptional regulator
MTEAAVAAREALSADQRPTALFCFSDTIAYGAYAAAQELGLRIPEDLSVAGYDDQPVSRLLSPPLTTFTWDIDRIIAAAVRLVLTAVDKRPQRRRIVQSPTLCRRDSTGPIGS